MPTPTYLSAKRLQRFRNFELIAHRVVEGILTGQHKSPFKGFAIEFAEYRQYSPGDDIKHLDWKLLGKLNRYYIRQYEEDTSLHAYLLLDRSGSMAYKSGHFSKFDFGRFVCGVLTYVLLLQKDAVGLLSFDNAIREFMPPRTTRRHLKRVLDSLGNTECGADTQLGNVLHGLANRLKRRALIVIVSDLLDDAQEIIRALNHFAHRKHEVVVFQVLDRRELTFPFADQTRFESLEYEDAILTDPIRIRQEYLKQFKSHQTAVRQACHNLRIEFNQLVTDEAFESTMARYLAERVKR